MPEIVYCVLYIVINKNTWGVKKCGANIANRQARPKGLISAEAKKLLYQIFVNDTQYYSIFYKYDWLCTWPPFIIVYRYEKRWPSDKANHTCENML